jgi:hypothetical protein
MATQKIQVNAIWDRSSAANYKTTSQVIGNALSILGWVKDTGATWVSGGNYIINNLVLYSGTTYICIQTATGRTTAPSSDTSYWAATAGDLYAVNWSNVVAVPPTNALSVDLAIPNPRGAWATAVGSTGASFAINDMVTDGGLTYICQTAVVPLVVTQALQNTAYTLNFYACNATVYTFPTWVSLQAYVTGNTVVSSSLGYICIGNVTSSTAPASDPTHWTAVSANQFVNQIITVAGYTSSALNGAFVCTVSSTTGTVTLANGSAAAENHAATGTSSAANLTYLGTFTGGAANAIAGQSYVISGFVASTGVNNGTVTAIASNTTALGVVKTGTNETLSAAALEITAPGRDEIGLNGLHWSPYIFEIWVSQGQLSTANPIYLKLYYGITNYGYLSVAVGVGTGQTNGVLTGNVYNSGTLVFLSAANSAVDKGGATYECDFCGTADKVSWIGWRQLGVAVTHVISIDRAHDQNGADLDTYTTVLMATGAAGSYQILFKPGVGGAVPLTPNTKWPCINDGNASSAYNGMAPPYLCFPMPGYMANPVLGAIAMHSGDMNEGSLINTIMYGTSHTFLMTANLATGATLTASSAAGIQWEEF